jgi:hypothetical protein
MEREMHPVEETFKNYLNERFNSDKNISTGKYVHIGTLMSLYRFILQISSDMFLQIECNICQMDVTERYAHFHVNSYLFFKNKKIDTYIQNIDLGRNPVLNKEKAKEIVDELLNKLNITNL